MRLLTAVSGVRVPQQAPLHPKGCFFRVFNRTLAIKVACALRTRHCGHRTVRSLRPAGLPPAEQMPQLRCAVVLRTPYGGRVRGQAPQHPRGCFFYVFTRTPAIGDCVRPAHTTLRTPHSLTRHLLFRRVAPSPGRTECGTAQNATVARRSVFERGSTFPLRGAPPPPTRQHRFNAASAWARVRR